MQVLTPASPTAVFGYSLSGGLDVDDNGYPDLSVAELGGTYVTTFRGSPLVNVTTMIRDRKYTLNVTGNSDRVCPQGDIMLHW